MSCCNDDSWNCTNPCAAGDANSAACENLPSALDNFTKHFFGSVIKTEVNGQVTWSLPCSLDVGLQNNPRGADEGLACYFLRLFNEGIIGATGPQGPAGNNGADGRHAFTVTLESFTHPSVGSAISVKVYANPSIQVGQIVFVGGSGWYNVDAISGDYTLVGTLLEPISGASGLISAGRTVTVTGPRGLTGAGGATGATGPIGPQGPAGAEYTPTNFFTKCSGSNHTLTLAIAEVQFAGTEPQLTLPAVGEYLVRFDIGVEMDATAAAAPGEEITFKVWNATSAAYETDLETIVQYLLPSQEGRVVAEAIVQTVVANETLSLYGQISVDGKGYVVPTRTRVSYVRLS